MKLWQLYSLMYDEATFVDQVASKNYHVDYPLKKYFDNIDSHIKLQNREILDSKIPEEIVKEILAKSKKIFYVSSNYGVIANFKIESDFKPISILRAYIFFGGSFTEEIHEKSFIEIKNIVEFKDYFEKLR